MISVGGSTNVTWANKLFSHVSKDDTYSWNVVGVGRGGFTCTDEYFVMCHPENLLPVQNVSDFDLGGIV